MCSEHQSARLVIHIHMVNRHDLHTFQEFLTPKGIVLYMFYIVLWCFMDQERLPHKMKSLVWRMSSIHECFFCLMGRKPPDCWNLRDITIFFQIRLEFVVSIPLLWIESYRIPRFFQVISNSQLRCRLLLEAGGNSPVAKEVVKRWHQGEKIYE
jgi:hypothetical protein